MIVVTEEAKALIDAQEIPEGTVLRLDPLEADPDAGADAGADPGGEVRIGLAPGEPEEGDQVIEHEGGEVLRIAAPVSALLSGSTIDVVTPESRNGSGPPDVTLGIRPPTDGSLTDGS